MRTDFDAIIVGAGPAGSTAAILLARAGWAVALVEKQLYPRRKVCGECIAASNLPLLNALGVGSAFDAAAGPPLRHIALMHGMRTVVANFPLNADPEHPWGRALAREALDTLLLEKARLVGAHVLQPWSIKRIQGTVGAWRCDARENNSADTVNLHAPVLIDAHGSWESLGDVGAQRRMSRSGSDLLAFKANFQDAKLEQGLLPVLMFNGGYGGMVLAGRGMTTVAGCIRRDRLDALRSAWPGLSAGDTFEAMLRRECAGVRQTLRSSTRVGPWVAAGPLDTGIRVDVADQFFRIGNAAGEAHPIIGEGMSMALQSAWLLCSHLLTTEVHPRTPSVAWQGRVAFQYATDWRNMFQPRMRIASIFANAAMRPVLASTLLTVAQLWPGLLTFGAIHGGKTSCSVGSHLFGADEVPDPLSQLNALKPTEGRSHGNHL